MITDRSAVANASNAVQLAKNRVNKVREELRIAEQELDIAVAISERAKLRWENEELRRKLAQNELRASRITRHNPTGAA